MSIHILFILVNLTCYPCPVPALIIALELLLSPFVARSKNKPYPRIIGDASFRFLADYFSGPELQRILGSSVDVYSTWARNAGLPITIEEMVDGGKLMWIGPKRTDKMLLYCHGAFLSGVILVIVE